MDNIVKRFKTRSKISIDFCDLWAFRQHFIKNSHDFVVDFFFRIQDKIMSVFDEACTHWISMLECVI